MNETKLPRGLRNNNPLNIRKGNDWQGEQHPQTDSAFEQFETLEHGYRAAFIIIRNYLAKRPPINTPRAIIARWAPPSENHTQRYLDFVCKRAVLNPDETLRWSTSGADKNKICMLVWAMAEYENGMKLSFGRVENGFALACR